MRRGLFSLLIPLCLCSPAYSQVDSGSHANQTVSPTPDSNRSVAPDTHQTVVAPAVVADPVSKPEIITEPLKDAPKAYPVYWLAGAGLIGLLVGAFGYHLLFRKKEDELNAPLPATESEATDESEIQLSLEGENVELHAQNSRLMAENEQLKRDNAELEQLLHTANDKSDMSGGLAKEIIFYMPQPNMNGRFQEASRRTDAANALYEFHVQHDLPGVASFEFIGKDAYLNAAIGNEPSWIAIACDRTNQPSASTTRVKTNVPGLAHLKDGEWEITRKAKITYL